MAHNDMYISVSLEMDEAEPIADIAYRGVQWASVTFVRGEWLVTFYGEQNAAPSVPLDDALAALEEAKRRLSALTEESGPRQTGA